MMSKTSSKILNLIKKISILPIVIVLTLSLCEKTIAQTKKTIKTKISKASNTKKPNKKDVFIYQKTDTNVTVIESLPIQKKNMKNKIQKVK